MYTNLMFQKQHHKTVTKEYWIYRIGFPHPLLPAPCFKYSHTLVIFWYLSNPSATKISVQNLRPDHSKDKKELYLHVPLARQTQRTPNGKKNLSSSSISSTCKWTTSSQMAKLKIWELLCSFSLNPSKCLTDEVLSILPPSYYLNLLSSLFFPCWHGFNPHPHPFS